MSKLIALGEALIDFVPIDVGCELKEVTGFMKSPGGAPANVAACVAKLGQKAKVMTQLGEDAFGDFLIESMYKAGIDITSILRTNKANTALAFISLKEDGEREFSFYRKPSADMLLEADSIKEDYFEEGDILHFCSVNLVDAPVRKAHDRAIEIAKSKGCIICFDPNVRLPLWEDHKAYQEVIRAYIPHVNILKVSDEELTFITGIEEEALALEWLKAQVDVLVYTKGKDGAQIITNAHIVEHLGFPTKAVDTTGAGDSFIGAILYNLLNEEVTLSTMKAMSREQWESILCFANATAAIVVTRKGAIHIMLSIDQVRDKMK